MEPYTHLPPMPMHAARNAMQYEATYSVSSLHHSCSLPAAVLPVQLAALAGTLHW